VQGIKRAELYYKSCTAGWRRGAHFTFFKMTPRTLIFQFMRRAGLYPARFVAFTLCDGRGTTPLTSSFT
jgi:hypothetical protein